MYNYNSNIIQFGWKCPECGAIMAPWQNTCINHHGNSNPQITNVPHTTSTPSISWNTITCKANTPDITLTSNTTSNNNLNKLSESLKSFGITT